MDIHESEEKYIFFHNANQDKKGEFEINLSDTLNLTQYECALFDLNLPNKIKTEKFFVERYIYLNLVWVKKIDFEIFEKDKRPEYFDEETNPEAKTPLKVDLKIGPNIETLDQLKNAIIEVTKGDSIHDKIESLYKTRFAKAFGLEDQINLFYPKISFDNGFFRNVVGEIRFRGLTKKYLSEFTEVKVSGEPYLEETYISSERFEFFKTKAAFLYFTFDEELHEILGFDGNKYPNVRITETTDEIKCELYNNGWADYKCEIDWFNLIYIYTDIVRESYCGNIKANILKVVTRESDDQKDIIHYSFPNLLFVPLRVDEIRTIKFKLCDSFGQIIAYTKGMISMTLFMRPRRNGF